MKLTNSGITKIENNLLQQGYQRLVGVDEVGYGSIAGPMVACAYSPNFKKDLVDGVNDSKKLSSTVREKLSVILRNVGRFAFGVVSVDEINILGMSQSGHLARERAIVNLWNKVGSPGYILIDFFKLRKDWGVLCQSIPKGDEKVYSIAAASIVAKVYRDALMIGLSNIEPMYSCYLWWKNKGYGTPEHFKAIEKYGLSKHHRLSYSQVEKHLKDCDIERIERIGNVQGKLAEIVKRYKEARKTD